jgi:hypothetical protein
LVILGRAGLGGVGQAPGRLGVAPAPAQLDPDQVVLGEVRPPGELPLAEPPLEPPVLEARQRQPPAPQRGFRPPHRPIFTRTLGTLPHASNLLPRSVPSISPPGGSLNGSPEPVTGAPDKNYRGPRQGSPSGGRPPPRYAAQTGRNSPLPGPAERTGVPDKRYRGPRQAVPGSPTKTTGVPDKNYRGPRQKLPGSPTKTTGVPDKNYRGPRQAAPAKCAAKRRILSPFSGALCFCFLSSVMLFNNNYRENGEVFPCGPKASS